MTIDELYRTVRVVANKEQRGFLKPSEFNLLADRAQMELFTQRYNNLKLHQTASTKSGVMTLMPGAAFGSTQKAFDDLRPFLAYNQPLTFTDAGTDAWTYPTDYIHAIALTLNNVEVELIGEDKLMKSINSTIVPPSPEHPIAIQDRSGFVIFNSGTVPTTGALGIGTTVGTVRLSYLARPTRPQWAFEEINGNPIYNPSNSTDLQFNEQTHNEIAMKILSYLGIHIRETDLQTAVNNKEQTGV